MTEQTNLTEKKVRYAEGDGYHLGKAKNQTTTFRAFAESFRKPMVTPETCLEYQGFPDQKQQSLKRCAGWTIRCHVVAGKRTRDCVTPGDLITLDIDNASPDFSRQLMMGDILPGVTFFAHTTRSHTPEKPRWRIVIPTLTEVDPDRYQAAVRIIAQEIDPKMVMVDKVSARPAQMMFRPTCSRDMEQHYQYYQQPGDPIDVEAMIADWEKASGLDSKNIATLPTFKGEKVLRETAKKVEDPRLKKGPVGAWCRYINCVELVTGHPDDDADVEPILADKYAISEYGADGSVKRLSYLGGHSANGVLVYNDGDLVYSHHGSDPAADMTLNSWDLVRYHLFDAKNDDETKRMGQRESWKKMLAFAQNHPGYLKELAEERFSQSMMAKDVDDDDDSWVIREGDVGYAPEAPEPQDKLYRRLRAEEPPEGWVASELELTIKGTIKNTLPNVAAVVTNDPRLWRKIAFNAFSNQTVLLTDIKTKNKKIPNLACKDKRKGQPWVDVNDIVIRAILELPPGPQSLGYGMKVTDRDLRGGIELAGRNNAFHPILDDIQKWREMGPPAKDPIKDFLHRHLGAEKSVYTDQVLRMTLVASIARVTTPGCKFDYAPILEGATGIGKSTFIKLIYGEDYFGELDVDLANRQEVAEQTAGKWCLEMPELGSLTKVDYNHAKAFMRRQHDDVRMAYGRSISVLPRQFVTWGTTNESVYLRDPTGNRSYWVIKCGAQSIDFETVLRERNDLWRQAVADYDAMRSACPNGDLPLTLSGDALERARGLQQEARQKEMWEEWLEDVIERMEAPVRLGLLYASMGVAMDELDENYDRMVKRVAFTRRQAALSLGFREGVFSNQTQQIAWEKLSAALVDKGWTRQKCRIAGQQKRWIIFPGASEEERRQGYFFVAETEPAQNDDLI
ncbi:VapE domain-containing protein [Silicimonas sp. MF1-12-2]|uniref:VapE domain-containing protein n=1 Tax=Silicimonas sp. MF1-12-2 TaxID=3384793 RepID=UPI0039B5FE44